MSSALAATQNEFLGPAGADLNDLTRIIDSMLSHKIDFAELYFQSSRHESWVLESGIVKDASFSADKGVGVRALVGEKTGFAYSEEILLPALERAAEASRSIATRGNSGKVKLLSTPQQQPLYTDDDPIMSLSEKEKLAILKKLDQLARQLDPRVTEVIASLSGVFDKILICASDGTLASDIRPLIRANVTVIMQDKGKTERGGSGIGGRENYHMLSDELLAELAKEAVHQASINLEAIDAPAGNMPVVLGPGWPGVLLHEAIGHGLEGDFNRKGSSAFSGRIGQRVASPLCTIVDDGTIASRRGSLTIDDEGTQSQSTTLIENGVLVGYMQDKKNARLMNTQSTGNGRRESYSSLPLPRMTNTYMLSGESEPEDIIRSVKKGIYAPNFGGGQVDITSGKFVFTTSEAYLIEDGKVTAPVKGATLIGNGPDVLTKVSMVGNDLELDKGVGICGKEGQSVPVGVGQPTMKVDELTVGGTN
ncbi:metalloprotease TldD [Aliikangiella coralliicola]|uniref:Metalloprotease TldD n=1 Tax=Aliikangiella coralliicola TaxID=2592383 RepID=A0A545UB12_9GAMM|nr:metalloprotease TldD [Aliikangiella coralliicola]TQV86664.1 metalloprotease TldD [Aliikangiella coralliicola]